jgi:phenylpropionate dioxygenase-like ring-hydroxylating dioxygenase large terminal subunit
VYVRRRDLDKAIPHRFVLLNTPLVMWWDRAQNGWRVFKDVCPHRLVPLSEGRINPKASSHPAPQHRWQGAAACGC